MDNHQYAGFWIRTAAALIDTILLMVVIVPLISMVYGNAYWTGTAFVFGFWDIIFNYVLPAIVIILFWVYKSATPGKMVLNLTVIDAKTGGRPSAGQFVGRYLGYYVSAIPLLLGIIWVGIDKRKQGWHDRLAGTLVVKNNDSDAIDG